MITLFASGTLSTTGSSTEDSLASCNVQGEFSLHVDLNDMAAGDRIRISAYAIALTGGTKRLLAFHDYEAVQPTWAVCVRPFEMLLNDLTDANSIQYTITQTHGTAGISLPWKVMKNDALTPTTTARTLDVSAGGEAGLDWANIGSPSTAQNLSATNIDVDQVVASVSGAVGSVTGAVGSVTGNVGGNVTGSVGSVAAGGITASSIAADAIGASELAADAVTEIAAGVLAATVTGTTTVAQSLMLLQATLAGKASGLATTSVAFRNIADTTDVIAATVDADGNRSAVTITYP